MRLFAILPLLVALFGCSGDDQPPDAGTESSTLEILDPPGDSIGLGFAADIELAVRYRGGSGEPVANVGVTFELVAGASESAGGAALSASIAGTSDDGLATVVLTAGMSDAGFRVRASAPGAAPVQFFVVVSSTGFAAFEVGVDHVGPRADDDYQNLEYRLYDPADLACAGLDIDALPDSVLPPRSADDIDASVEFTNLAARRSYTVLVWGEHTPGAARIGVGCVELAADQVSPGQPIALRVGFTDRGLRWSEPVALESVIVLSGLGTAIDELLAPDPFTIVGCDLGAAQLLIDCALDVAVPDGDLDCVVTGSGALADDLEALRAPADLARCRPDEISPGSPSLDRLVLDSMTAGPWTEADAVALALARDQLLSGVALDSELVASGPTLISHRLTAARVVGGGLVHEEDLTGSSRAVVRDDAVGAAIDASSNRVTIASHGFTLDIERTLAAAFDLELLVDLGLGGREADLGAALAESFGGCAAFSASICSRVSRPASCLESACDAAALALDSRLRAWIDATAGSGLDFTLSGSAVIEDRDFDLAVDAVGDSAASPDGDWLVGVETSAGGITGVGVFGGP